MKKFIEKHKTKFIIAVCILFTGIITASATTILASSEVSYSNTKSGLTASNVQDAIDELYTVAQLSERIDELESKVDDYWKTVYPVGSIYISIKNTNPGTTFGGTWVAYGSGRTMVGVDSSQTEFNAVEKTGGEKTHTLTIDEMPKHSHGLYLYTPNGSNTTVTTRIGEFHSSSSPGWLDTNAIAPNGSSMAHNNLQPYITVYMWKRTA